MNKDFLKTSVDPMPLVGWGTKGCDRGLEGFWIVAADVQPGAEGDHLTHTGMFAQLLR
jgi:hypothetical protein